MTSPLDALPAQRKQGHEPFHASGLPIGPHLTNFWQWMGSDVVSNTMRGLLAEYLVATALGVADGVRLDWEAYDLTTRAGVTIEVKSAAYLQRWQQAKPSAISFSIRQTKGWNAETNTIDTTLKRQAALYVFALLAHREKTTLDPLDVRQWQFFVLPTHRLDAVVPQQKTIGLNALRNLQPRACAFAALAETIEHCATELAADGSAAQH
ncbi:MAG TPA: hypothetical protein VGE07_14175 [Herpetosiphonaceae bacterium]